MKVQFAHNYEQTQNYSELIFAQENIANAGLSKVLKNIYMI